MVPLGMASSPAACKLAVYTKEQWAKAAKNEKIDEGPEADRPQVLAVPCRRLHGGDRGHH